MSNCSAVMKHKSKRLIKEQPDVISLCVNGNFVQDKLSENQHWQTDRHWHMNHSNFCKLTDDRKSASHLLKNGKSNVGLDYI